MYTEQSSHRIINQTIEMWLYLIMLRKPWIEYIRKDCHRRNETKHKETYL